MTTNRHLGPDPAATSARARVIDFETLAQTTIRNGYEGFDWFHLDGSGFGSGDQVARNVWAEGSGFSLPSGSFELSRLSLQSAGSVHFRVTIFGWLDGELVAERTIRIAPDHDRVINLRWEGIDTVTFNSDVGDYWNLDDIAVRHVVRDPSSTPLSSKAFDADSEHLDHALLFTPPHQGDLHHLTQLV